MPQKNKVSPEKKKIENLGSHLEELLNGVSKDFLSKNREDFDRVNKAVAAAIEPFKQNVSGDLLTFLDVLNHSGKIDKKSSKPLGPPPGNKLGNSLINLNKLLEKGNTSALNNLLGDEKERLILYGEFRSLPKLIPELKTALETYTDNILSPDGFRKEALNYSYTELSGRSNISEDIERKVKSICDSFEIEKLAPKIVKKALRDGDYFLAVLPLKEKLANIFLNEALIPDGLNSPSETTASGYFSSFFSNDPVGETENKVLEEEIANLLETSETTASKSPEERNLIKSKFFTKVKNKISPIIDKNLKFSIGNEQKWEMSDFKDVNSSILKHLPAENVVKLEHNNTNFGYLYFDIPTRADRSNEAGALSGTVDLLNTLTSDFNSLSGGSNTSKGISLKRKFIYKIFIEGIKKKVKKEFIKNNPEFLEILYRMLKEETLFTKETTVYYYAPSEVVHFGDDSSEEVYYESIFSEIIFTAKLYISILTSTLMYKIVRAPANRVFYVDTGLDMDEGGNIDTFIRDIKSKEISLDAVLHGNMDSVLSFVSNFNDIFIPTVNGEKPITVEAMDSAAGDLNLDSDILDYLKTIILGGIGIPKSLISELENLDFAKSLSVINLRFLRNVSRKQLVFNRQFSEFGRLLYKNEMLTEINDSLEGNDVSKNKKKAVSENYSSINLEYLKLYFSPPSSLEFSNIAENIREVGEILEFIISLHLDSRSDTFDKDSVALKKLLAKQFFKNLPWEVIDSVLKKFDLQKAKEALKASGEAPADDQGSSGGGW